MPSRHSACTPSPNRPFGEWTEVFRTPPASSRWSACAAGRNRCPAHRDRRCRAQRRSRMPAGHRCRRRFASWTAASTTASSSQRRATGPHPGYNQRWVNLRRLDADSGRHRQAVTTTGLKTAMAEIRADDKREQSHSRQLSVVPRTRQSLGCHRRLVNPTGILTETSMRNEPHLTDKTVIMHDRLSSRQRPAGLRSPVTTM